MPLGFKAVTSLPSGQKCIFNRSISLSSITLVALYFSGKDHFSGRNAISVLSVLFGSIIRQPLFLSSSRVIITNPFVHNWFSQYVQCYFNYTISILLRKLLFIDSYARVYVALQRAGFLVTIPLGLFSLFPDLYKVFRER